MRDKASEEEIFVSGCKNLFFALGKGGNSRFFFDKKSSKISSKPWKVKKF